MPPTRSSERSNDTRWAITETASAAEAWVLAQCASWRVRSRSTARADAVHVRVRAIARRNNSDGDTPVATACSRQAACSPGGDHHGATLRHGCTGGEVRGPRPRASAARTAARKAGGSKGGAASPRQPPCSTRSRLAYAPQRCQTAPGPGRRTVCATGNFGTAASPYRTRRSPNPIVSTARIEAVSQDFQRRPGVGSAAGDGTSVNFSTSVSDASLAGSGGCSPKRAQARRGLVLDARAKSLSEEDPTIPRIALLDQADSGLSGFGGFRWR